MDTATTHTQKDLLLIVWMQNGYAFYDFGNIGPMHNNGFCITRRVAQANNYTIRDHVQGETFLNMGHNTNPILLLKKYLKKDRNNQTLDDVDVRLINPCCIPLN